MPPKRSNAVPKVVEDVQDGGGAAAKRKRFIPRKIVRGEVESPQAVPPATTRPSAAATAAAAAGNTTIAFSASTSSGCTASTAGQPSVSNSPTVGLELLPAKRTRVASMKARELAERKRSGVLDCSTDESDDDEPCARYDGDNDIAYNSPERQQLSAGKRFRWQRSATAAGITENDVSDQPSHPPVTVAALNDDGDTGDQGKGRRSAAAGSAVPAVQLTDGAAAAAVGDRAQSSKPKTVACSTCHKLVECDDINNHIKNVHSDDKRHKCPHCDYASPWKGNLNTHIAGVHVKARSHECSRCKLMFKTRVALIGHERKVHDRMYQPTERTFECEECHKKFFRKFHLQRHERVHTGEKPYLCAICDKKFTSKSNMDRHVKSVHLKVMPFRCSYCEKGFGRKKLVEMHERKCHIHNAPMSKLTDDEEDVDGDEVDDDEKLSSGQAPAAEGGSAADLLNSIVHSAATSSASLAASAAGVSAAVPGSSSSSASATTTAALAATTSLVHLRKADGKETPAQMPAGSVQQAVQAIDGAAILLTTPASPSSLVSVAGGHQQLAAVPSADGNPETILAVETVGVSADGLLASTDKEAAEEPMHFPPDGTA